MWHETKTSHSHIDRTIRITHCCRCCSFVGGDVVSTLYKTVMINAIAVTLLATSSIFRTVRFNDYQKSTNEALEKSIELSIKLSEKLLIVNENSIRTNEETARAIEKLQAEIRELKGLTL